MNNRDTIAEQVRPDLASTIRPQTFAHARTVVGLRASETTLRPIGERAARPLHGPLELRAGDLLASRYTLFERIGEGAQGEVWSAQDRLLGEPVAIKWLPLGTTSASARGRREIAVLRLLRAPGVVALVDEGTFGDRQFVVMEFVKGAPFPGVFANEAALWPHIESASLGMLEALGRVHAEGVIHRDLKPANVLVTEKGIANILDFGISSFWDVEPGAIVGTPAYMAPEQVQGSPLDLRADLYAVGVMLFEALSGQLPHSAETLTELFRKRVEEPVAPLASVAPNVPSHVAAAIDRLVARSPEHRYRSAREALAALQGDSAKTSKTIKKERTKPYSKAELRAFFRGPDRLFHLREDPANLLFEASRGHVASVEQELARWERLGLCRRDGERRVVDRGALSNITSLRESAEREASISPWLSDEERAKAHREAAERMNAGDKGRLYHLVSAGDVVACVAEAVETGRVLAERGDLRGATDALSLGLSRSSDPRVAPALRTTLLSEVVNVALSEGAPSACDRALYELSRAEVSPALVDSLMALVRAAIAAPGANGVEVTSRVEPFADPVLERRRIHLRVAAAAARTSPSLIRTALEEASLWEQRSQSLLAKLAVFEGTARLRYVEGRFEEAAKLHCKAAELETQATGKLAAISNAASAFLEAFRHKEALRYARVALRLAQAQRSPRGECRAEWILRAARYRRGEALVPDLELVSSAERVAVPGLFALVCLNEAAVALRLNERVTAIDLATRAARTWRALDRTAGALLGRSVAIAAGSSAELSEQRALCEQAVACEVPEVGLQVIGLLRMANFKLVPDHAEALGKLYMTVPPPHRGLRMDVLSADEAHQGQLLPAKARKLQTPKTHC